MLPDTDSPEMGHLVAYFGEIDHANRKLPTTETLRLLYRFTRDLARLFASPRLATQGGGLDARHGPRRHRPRSDRETDRAIGLAGFESQWRWL